MRRLFSAVAAVTIATAAVVTVAEPAFAVTYCDNFMTGTISQNLIVPEGADCTLEEATVGGNVMVREGGTLTLIGTNVTHSNITAHRPGGIFINHSHISGNVTISRL